MAGRPETIAIPKPSTTREISCILVAQLNALTIFMGPNLAMFGSVKTPIYARKIVSLHYEVYAYLAGVHILEVHADFTCDTLTEPKIRGCNLNESVSVISLNG